MFNLGSNGGDIQNRQTSLNAEQGYLDSDGVLGIVVCADDVGASPTGSIQAVTGRAKFGTGHLTNPKGSSPQSVDSCRCGIFGSTYRPTHRRPMPRSVAIDRTSAGITLHDDISASPLT